MSVNPLRLTSPRAADLPRKYSDDRFVFHEQANAGVGVGIEEQHARSRQDICPPPRPWASSSVGCEFSKATGGLGGRNVRNPLLVALNCVAADSLAKSASACRRQLQQPA